MSDFKPTIEPEDYRHLVLSKLLLLALVGFTVHLNSLIGTFALDDERWIVNNPAIHDLSLAPDGWLSPRRLVLFTFAVNHAISGVSAWSYHLVNIAIHVLAGLTLFGLVCRTLLRTYTDSHSLEATPWIAFVAALLWLVHPLQTASVTYLSMRAEVLMGLFYLVTMYCVLRGTEGERAPLWYGLAILACALGMCSKLDMVTAPLAVLLFDRVYLSDSFAAAIRRRWSLYLGLLATGMCLVGPVPPADGSPVPGMTAIGYWLAQPVAVLYYLRLALVPYPLTIDYADWPPGTVGGIAVPALVVAILLAVTAWALIRHPKIGFLGAWFFLTLLPSCLIPGGPAVAEWRMYLPLAGPVVLVVVGGYALARRLVLEVRKAELAAVGGAGLLMVAWGFLTFLRNTDYYSGEELWQATVNQRPNNVRARINLGNAFFQHGVAYFRLGKKDQGVAEMDRAAAEYRTVLESSTSEHRGAQLIAVNNLAAVFVVTGRPEEAIQLFTSLPQASTEGQAQALDRLAADFAAVGKFPEAIRTAQKAMQLAAAAKNTTLEHQIQEELEIYQDKQSQGKKPPRK